jgi:hypothetical protein
MNLQQFLSTEFQDAQQRLKQIAEQSRHAVRTLTHACKDGTVPYHLQAIKPKQAGEANQYPADSNDYSHSTHAMVLHSLALANGRLENSVLAAGRIAFMVLHREQGVNSVIKDMGNKLKEALKIYTPRVTNSGTYGNNDPLTVSWLADLQKNNIIIIEEPEFKKYVIDDVLIRELKNCFSFKLDNKKDEKKVNPHAFPVLRQCLIHKSYPKDDPSEFKSTRSVYFLERLHRHLSLAVIPDSRFDPAEMVFSLEGALVLEKGSVDVNTLNRVIEVLSASQEKSAYWRPVAPMLFTTRGLALHPLSIEVANSLMRICSMKDEGKRHNRLFSRIEPMLRRYYDWLAAQMVTIPIDNDGDYSGWHSENISDENRIDVWETSQVLNFLQSYGALLNEQIACDALIASGLKVEDLERTDEYKERTSIDYWNAVQDIYEPFKADRYAVFENIGKYYVEPRAGDTEINKKAGDTKINKEKCFSMVLYGPPGTGKSTIPEELAKCLKQPLITVTISDFLGDGAAQTEQRAKALFQVLEAQRDVVVLFDEIDHFILDRESKIYGEQDTVFQFMPPGMLTKLRDLRQKKNCIFIIATNYMERIDAAAVRLGRIDHRYLVMPPSRSARLRILEAMDKNNVYQLGDYKTTMPPNQKIQLDKLLTDTSFYIYKELESVWNNSEGSQATERLESLKKSLHLVSPSTTLSSYRKRFKVKENDGELLARRLPTDEFLLLVYYRFCDETTLTPAEINQMIVSDAALLAAVYNEVVDVNGVEREIGNLGDVGTPQKIFSVLEKANKIASNADNNS